MMNGMMDTAGTEERSAFDHLITSSSSSSQACALPLAYLICT